MHKKVLILFLLFSFIYYLQYLVNKDISNQKRKDLKNRTLDCLHFKD